MKCAVRGCSNNTFKKIPGLSFHLFPKCQKLKEAWLETIGRPDLKFKKWLRICSRHFKEEDVNKTLNIRRLKDDAFPTLFLSFSPSDPYESAFKWQYKRAEPTNHENHFASDVQAANHDDDDEESITLNDSHDDTRYDDDDMNAGSFQSNINASGTEEAHIAKEYPLHHGFTCNGCHHNIIGFRYVCLQCVDWDMCASCEARGEHPEHYVLRLPAPTTYVKYEAVMSAIRQHLDDLLKLNDEMQGILIKKENIDDVKKELDQDEADLSAECNEQSVPQVDVHHKTITISIPPALPVDVPTRNMPPHYNEQSVVNPETITQKVKEEPTDCPLLIDETLPRTNHERFIKTEPNFSGEYI